MKTIREPDSFGVLGTDRERHAALGLTVGNINQSTIRPKSNFVKSHLGLCMHFRFLDEC